MTAVVVVQIVLGFLVCLFVSYAYGVMQGFREGIEKGRELQENLNMRMDTLRKCSCSKCTGLPDSDSYYDEESYI